MFKRSNQLSWNRSLQTATILNLIIKMRYPSPTKTRTSLDLATKSLRIEVIQTSRGTKILCHPTSRWYRSNNSKARFLFRPSPKKIQKNRTSFLSLSTTILQIPTKDRRRHLLTPKASPKWIPSLRFSPRQLKSNKPSRSNSENASIS